jgi:exocyst complex component 4
MSRAPPFPTRRRSPSITNTGLYTSQPLSAPGTSTTRPLQISRPGTGSRPTTPINPFTSNSPLLVPPSTAPIGPSWPQRSELRTHAGYSASERASTSSQDPFSDSIGASRLDVGGTPYRTLPSSVNIPTNGPPPRQRSQRLKSPISDNGDETTPTSLNSALSAFKSAGSRRRQTPEDVDDYNYRRERELEIEAEKARQQRIRERAPGVRAKGRVGEIDGKILNSACLLRTITGPSV